MTALFSVRVNGLKQTGLRRVLQRTFALTALCAASVAIAASAFAQAKIGAASAATVQNVQVSDFYGRSVVLRWAAPLNTGLSGFSGYYVKWQAGGETAFESKVAIASAGLSAFQVQPLDPAKTYTVSITPMDFTGIMGTPLTITNVSPKGVYENTLRAATGNGTTGFLYLPENDPVNGRINPVKINNDVFQMYSGEAKGAYFDHSCIAVNNQQHWHMIGNDQGTGSITSRIKAKIPVDDKTRVLTWDCDAGPYARQAWYIVLTPNKIEQFLLFPSNGDTNATGVAPQEQIQVKFIGPNATFSRYSGGNLINQQTINWRQTIYANVRQIMAMGISKTGLHLYADTNYNGQVQDMGTYASDISGWSSCYAYFTLGSYNNRKTDTVQGFSATGQPMLEYQGADMHWGNVAVITPDGIAPPAELSYFQIADLKTRFQNIATSPTVPITVTIPDAIPADAVAQELVFTDRSSCIPCLSGTNKLRLSVNGVLLPNKQEAAAWADFPTYRWPVPAGVLKKGANTVLFSEDGIPDPITVANIHFDILVPATSPAIAAYTPPPAHPVLETMPDHTEMDGWTIPFTQLTAPTKPIAGTISLPVVAHSGNTLHLAGSAVPLDKVWVEVNGKTLWSQDTNAAGVGSAYFSGQATLNTTTLPDGYYEAVLKAHSKSGSLGYNNGSNPYGYNTAQRVLIVNAAPNKIAPQVLNFRVNPNDVTKLISMKQGDNYYVRPNSTYGWNFDIRSHNILWQVALTMKASDGTTQTIRTYSPSTTTPTKTGNSDPVYSFADLQTLWGWWPLDKNGQDVMNVVATDVFGLTATYPVTWTMIQSPPPAPPASQLVPPVVNAFTCTPQTVTSGWACQLAWDTTGAVTATIDNGIGAVGATGHVCVTPKATTTYTLTIVNTKGTVTKKITVTVK